MNCPICQNNCYTDTLRPHYCFGVVYSDDLNSTHNFVQFDTNYVMTIVKKRENVISIHHQAYQSGDYWWHIRMHENPIDRIIAAGSNQLSYSEAWKLLQRYHKLLIFS